MDAAPRPARLVADIGGTNARFALTDARGVPADVHVLPTDGYPGVAEAVEAYLAHVGRPCPPQAALAIATAITGDEVRMTNHPWAFSQRGLQARLGLRRLVLLNDFTALALALPDLPADELEAIGGGAAVAGAPLAVLGPGTGLGVSGLLRQGGTRIPVSGEGGHVTLAAGDDEEARIIARVRAQVGHVSAERLLSGEGLVRLAEAIAALRGETRAALTAADVARGALEGGDAVCRAALETFCALLGSVAGNLALTLGARGGVYLGGGIVPRLGPFLAQSRFRRRFEDKGRLAGYLAAIPCYVIRSPWPALVGAASALGEAG